jgi:hypothetical protein
MQYKINTYPDNIYAVEKLRILVIKQLFVVLVNTVISWIRLADLNPCTTCTMYISLTIFLFRSGIAFYFHLFSTVQVTIRPKQLLTCDHWLVEVQKSKHRNVCINIIRICINFVLDLYKPVVTCQQLFWPYSDLNCGK